MLYQCLTRGWNQNMRAVQNVYVEYKYIVCTDNTRLRRPS